MAARRLWKRRNTVAGLGLPVALMAASLAASAQAQTPHASAVQVPAPAASPCPAAVPISSVHGGLVGRGLTVVVGQTPQPFAVSVLGVLTNGLAPGRDLVMVEVSDLPGHHVIDQGGGIWEGMSGSPVYVGDRLLGAISYGFTSTPSRIGALTPAVDMFKLLDRPSGSVASAVRDRAVVPLSPAARSRLATQAAASVPRGSLQRLPMPLAVSGLGQQRLDRLQSQAESNGAPVVAYPAASRSAPGPSAALAKPRPGGNFAEVMSYGDVSSSAVGTTTAVCGNQALAFGHAFAFAGATTYGANDATSLAIVKDDVNGSFKYAVIGKPFGTVVQDRRAGISARLGVLPATVAVTTTIHNVGTGRGRTGITRVTDERLLPGMTSYAVYANFDSTFDEIGAGSTTSHWSITGTRAHGVPFTLTRTNRWVDSSDVAGAPANDVSSAVDALVNNQFEPVHIKRVDFDATVTTAFRQLRITRVAVSVNGGRYLAADSLRVKAGATLKIRVTTVPYRSNAAHVVNLSVKVPAKTGGRAGVLTVSGGLTLSGSGDVQDPSCLLSDAGCDGAQKQSLKELMSGITAAPRNDDVVATLGLEPADNSNKAFSRSVTSRQTSVVTGSREISLDVRR